MDGLHLAVKGKAYSRSRNAFQVHIELKEISHATYRAMHGMEAKKSTSVVTDLPPDGEVRARHCGISASLSIVIFPA
jgi:hypothetical protein